MKWLSKRYLRILAILVLIIGSGAVTLWLTYPFQHDSKITDATRI